MLASIARTQYQVDRLLLDAPLTHTAVKKLYNGKTLLMHALKGGYLGRAEMVMAAGGRLTEREMVDIMRGGEGAEQQQEMASFFVNYPLDELLCVSPCSVAHYAATSDVWIDMLNRSARIESLVTTAREGLGWTGSLTPLCIASASGSVRSVDLLLGVPAVRDTVNICPSAGAAPALLHALRAPHGGLPVARLLLAAGADPLCVFDGRTALAWAQAWHGADPSYGPILAYMQVSGYWL
jgi:hypothetical protein